MDANDWTLGGIVTAISGLFGGVIVQQRNQVASTQRQLDKERESCGERISLLEIRLDKERDNCDERITRLERKLDDTDRRMRSMSPPPMRAVNPEE